MKTKRQLQIDAYIAQNSDAKLPGPLQVVVKGQNRSLDVFRLPIKFLIFNISNGRFASEMLAEEKRSGHELDPTNLDDEKIIRRFLLEQKEDETEALKQDLKKTGQIDPGIITFDGAVINGNRRMAILKLLYDETHDEKYEYLNVAKLPKGVDEKNLWKIEAKVQFGRDFRLNYGPVNELLKIRSGRDSGLSPKQISQALVGKYSEKDVEQRLDVLKLIDSYLHSIGQPGEYKAVDRVTQHFHSLQSSVISPLRKGPLKNEIPKVTQAGFAMINGGKHSHWKIRELREIVELDNARKELYRLFDKTGKPVSDAEQVGDAFSAAQIEVAFRKERDKPEKLAETACKALQQIDSKHALLKKSSFQKLLAEIRSEIDRLIQAGGVGGKKSR